MAYRRRRIRRKGRTYRRKHTSRGKSVTRKDVKKIIKGQMETKWATATSASALNPGVLKLNLLGSSILAGNTAYKDLQGNQLEFSGTQIRFRFHNTQVDAFWVRIVLAYSRDSANEETNMFKSDSGANAQDYIGGTADLSRIDAPLFKDKWRVKYSKVIKVCGTSGLTDNKNHFFWNTPFIKLNDKVKYNGTNRADDDIKPRLHWFFFAENEVDDNTKSLGMEHVTWLYYKDI